MSVKEVRLCDVYGGTGAIPCRVVFVCGADGEDTDNLSANLIAGHEGSWVRRIDLGTRARKRLRKFIERGLSPPGKENVNVKRTY